MRSVKTKGWKLKTTQEAAKCLKVIRVSDYTIENNQVIDIDTLCFDPWSEK